MKVHEGGVPLVQLGQEVFTSDGTSLGPVKRIWWADGRVEPPERQSEGTFTIVNDERRRERAVPFFQIDRPLSPDWYVPFSAVGSNLNGRLILNVTYREAEQQPWQVEPE